MKRFYKDVTTGPALEHGWLVLLDGRPVRTPGKELLTAPTEKMAQALKAEWDAQTDEINPRLMPITTLLTTYTDRSMQEREAITLSVLAYLNGDLLCYRAPDDDSGLAAEQARLWDPWLTWFAGRFGHTLQTTTALSAFNQPDDAHTDVAGYIANLDDQHFNVLQVATALGGSIVMALALLEGAITAQQMYECALCEELFYERAHKLEQHGLDPIEERRRAGLMEDILACQAYLRLLD